MIRDRIAAVLVTLGKIEVHGRDNLSRLLGCMQELEKLMNGEEQANA